MTLGSVRWFIMLAIGVSLNALAMDGEEIRVCGDGAGWPPYTYELAGEVAGYDVDVLERILTPAGVSFTVEMQPWARCTGLTETGAYHIALSASYSAERAQTYLLTAPYYTVQPSYIFDRNRYPNGLDVSEPADLVGYRLCGLRGYNYTGFGVANENVDQGTNTFVQVVNKTLAGRCDAFLARYEILAGFSALGQNHLREGLTAEPIPGVEADQFHMMISRQYPGAEELVQLLNRGFEALAADGTLESLLQGYLRDQGTSD